MAKDHLAPLVFVESVVRRAPRARLAAPAPREIRVVRAAMATPDLRDLRVPAPAVARPALLALLATRDHLA